MKGWSKKIKRIRVKLKSIVYYKMELKDWIERNITLIKESMTKNKKSKEEKSNHKYQETKKTSQ
jgi:hypothetical protein